MLAQWLMKTAITFNLAAVKGKLRVSFPTPVAFEIRVGKIPSHCWIDLGFSHLSTVGGAISKCFRVVNGGQYQPCQVGAGLSFRFTVQFNHLLLRICRAPEAHVDYDTDLGGRPIRLYPVPDREIPSVPDYADLMKFEHSVVLRTWRGCRGNVPSKVV